MNNPVFLALYKHKRSWRHEPWKAFADAVTRFFTKGQYSHCELAVKRTVQISPDKSETFYDCYSASVQDGGVRCKQIEVSDKTKWDLIPLDGITEAQIRYYFELTKGKKYDWWGAVGIVLGIKQKRSKYFCSEWCFNALKGSEEGWRFSPSQLAVIAEKKTFNY